ncbi:hypothetical protein [Arenivirga flava]|uniref:hypothetical protein n=1 Tax=Arenivirga flava TaxID=1930060 RepID=UPI0024E0D5CF|nr:hypothetical protein [Arenivirga flava]
MPHERAQARPGPAGHGAGGGGTGARLRISARNPLGDATGGEPGYGLVGIDERARSVGGTSTAAVVGGEHRVDVELPWAAS